MFIYCRERFSKVLNPMKSQLYPALSDIIAKERNLEWKISEGEKNAIRDLCEALLDLGEDEYQEYFIIPFIQGTQEYLSSVKAQISSQMSYLDIMKFMANTWNREIEYTRYFIFRHSTLVKVNQLLSETFLEGEYNVVRLLCERSEIYDCLNDRLDHVEIIYDAMKFSKDGIDIICREFYRFIVDRGSEIIGEPADESSSPKVKFIPKLIHFVNHIYKSIYQDIFSSSSEFRDRMYSGLTHVLSNNQECVEYLCNYIHQIISEGNLIESEAEDEFKAIIIIYICLPEKDIFEKKLRIDLARRLISGKSKRGRSADLEMMLINHLKKECFCDYLAYTLESMYQDINILSENLNKEFVNYLGEDAECYAKFPLRTELKFDARIIKRVGWPVFDIYTLVLNPVMRKYVDCFSRFYSSKYSNRKLYWIHDLGKVTLVRIGEIKELVFHTVQAVILLLFNDADYYSLSDISTLIAVDEVNVQAHLDTLVKYFLLNKNNDVYSINSAFPPDDKSFSSRRINVLHNPVYHVKEFKESMHGNQCLIVDSAIVRIMKMHKALSHGELVEEVKDQLIQRFRLEVRDIKERIESLIEREYLERCDKDIYHYIA